MTEKEEILRDAAIRILNIWLNSAVMAINDNSKFGRRYACRWRAIALINHDRVLVGRKDLISTWTFSGDPGK